MATTETISQDLYDFLVTKNFDPEPLSAKGDPSGAEDAKVFSFDYISTTGKNYGTGVIVIADPADIKFFYGDNLGRSMEEPDKSEWFKFLEELSDFATQHRHDWTPSDISKLKYTMAGIAAIKEGLFEGYYGTRKVSYMGEQTQARLVIKHNRMLGENDKRYRYVESLYIETADSERFKLPFKNLSGGRAMLEHVRQGGKPYDVRGNHIAQLVNEAATLARFNRASQHRMLEGATKQLAEEATKYYQQVRETIQHLSTGKGYTKYFESWSPVEIAPQEGLVEDIKTLFIEQTLDTRIEQALPILARLQQQGNDMKEAQIFESWINQLAEGTWALPETPEQQAQLRELMSKPLAAGPNGSYATEELYDLVGDDQLFDIISEMAQQNPDGNIWEDQGVQRRLEELGVFMVTPETPAAPTAPETGAINENVILDEAGETLQHILDRFKHEVKRFKAGEELDSDLYDALFDYYMHSGEMPYGVAKARTGDPFAWISQRLDQDLGGMGFRGVDEADNIAHFVEGGTCNHTMEGEYCPEHGLAECGTTAGGMAPVIVGEQGVAEGVDNLLRKYYRNENDNLHSENVVLLAQHFGTPSELRMAKQALAYRNEQGGFDYSDPKAKKYLMFQQEINKKYYPLLKRQGVAEGSNIPFKITSNDIKSYTGGHNVDIDPEKVFSSLVVLCYHKFEDLGIKDFGAKKSIPCAVEIFKQYFPNHTGDIQNFVRKAYYDYKEAGTFGESHQGVAEGNDPINYNAAMTGSYYESKDDALARIKSLALSK